MAIPLAALPEGTRVRVRRARLPQDPRVTGRTGTVVLASEYRTQSLGVTLDGAGVILYFMPGELDVVESLPLPPERESAKLRRALP